MAIDRQHGFGTLLRRFRTALGLTQEELAERARLSARAISDLERGVKRRPHRDTVDLLAQALDLSPEERVALEASIIRTRSPVSDSPQSHDRHGIPAEVTPLIGREREEAEAVSLLRGPHCRLLTLTGAGGVGKTRLALRIAQTVSNDFQDRVFLAGLSSIRDSRLVAAEILGAMRLHPEGNRLPEECLRAALQPNETLLVLDNFEQVLSAASLVAHLLADCPRLKVLVTSREALHLQGEQEFEVRPLPVPGPSEHAHWTELRNIPAVTLFLQRARAVKPSIPFDHANAEAIAELCRRLDGLPLAIELAAARCKVFTPTALVSRLDDRLALLSRGTPELPPRQQTMRSAIDWSYDLLLKDEQQMLQSLSVFVGGWTLSAAMAVVNPTAAVEVVLDRITSLVDKSLLTVSGEDQTSQEPRFSMLETIREYLLDRLGASGEEAPVRARHAGYVLQLAEEAVPHLLAGTMQQAWFARITDEHDNVRLALQWALDTGNIEIGLRLGTALWRFWFYQGHVQEGRRWLRELLIASENSPTPVERLASALYASGSLAFGQDDLAEAHHLYERALFLQRELRDEAREAEVLNGLGVIAQASGDYVGAAEHLEASLRIYSRRGATLRARAPIINLANIARHQGDLTRATELYETSLAIDREHGDMNGVALCLNNLGLVATDAGDYARAHDLLVECLALARAQTNNWMIGNALNSLGSLALSRESYEQARAWFRECCDLCKANGDQGTLAFALANLAQVAVDQNIVQDIDLAEEALRLHRVSGNRRGEAFALATLGECARLQGDLPRAEAHHLDSLTIRQDTGDIPDTVSSLAYLARLHLIRGNHQMAVRIYAAADAEQSRTGALIPPLQRSAIEQDLVDAREALGELAYTNAWNTPFIPSPEY